jgi:hypothetical protein
MSYHFMCQILIQYIASLSRNHLQKWGRPYWKRQRNMKLPDVTECSAISDTFSVYLEKDPNANFDILEKAENMFKSIVHFRYMI